MNQKLLIKNLTRSEKEVIADALLSGKKFDKYLMSFGVIHPIEDLLLLHFTKDRRFFLFDTEIQVDPEKLECLLRVSFPRPDVMKRSEADSLLSVRGNQL